MKKINSNKLKLKNLSVFMEYPFFTMKNHSFEKVDFVYKNIELEITPGKYGLPSINDSDVLIYCISKLVEVIGENESVPQYIEFTAYEFFRKTERPTCGRSYRIFRETLLRLSDTQIRTNSMSFITAKEFINEEFVRFVDVVGFGEKGRRVRLKLSDWLCSMIVKEDKNVLVNVLTIDSAYFGLKPSEKIFYSLLRKHLGFSSSFCIRFNTLYKKMNIKTDIYEFRKLVIRIAKKNRLPGLRILYIKDTGMVYAFSRNKKGMRLMQLQLLK